MGQAKLRGAFQQRKAEAEDKRIREELARREGEWKSPVAMSARRRGKSQIGMLLAFAAASGVKF